MPIHYASWWWCRSEVCWERRLELWPSLTEAREGGPRAASQHNTTVSRQNLLPFKLVSAMCVAKDFPVGVGFFQSQMARCCDDNSYN